MQGRTFKSSSALSFCTSPAPYVNKKDSSLCKHKIQLINKPNSAAQVQIEKKGKFLWRLLNFN
jgi:hypothetical protein